MIQKKTWFPIVYMFCVTALFSSIVIGLTRLTSERVEANEMLAFERAVLSVLPGIQSDDLSLAEIHETFMQMIEPLDAATQDVYIAKKDGTKIAYVLTMSGQGFWAPIRGVIGLKMDRKTITGIAFYEQNETPGLGAEITKAPFRDQFVGKLIASNGDPMDVRRPGMMLDDNEVHAVTGATQTSDRLEIIINKALKQFRDQTMNDDQGTAR